MEYRHLRVVYVRFFLFLLVSQRKGKSLYSDSMDEEEIPSTSHKICRSMDYYWCMCRFHLTGWILYESAVINVKVWYIQKPKSLCYTPHQSYRYHEQRRRIQNKLRIIKIIFTSQPMYIVRNILTHLKCEEYIKWISINRIMPREREREREQMSPKNVWPKAFRICKLTELQNGKLLWKW